MKIKTYSLYIIILVVQFSWTQTTKVSPTLKQKVDKATTVLKTNETSPVDPVSINATLIWSSDKTQLAVVMKVSIQDQWHIYAYVPKTQPYITSELQLELPKGITKIGNWEKPYSEPYDDGVFVYHGDLVFVQYCSVGNFSNDAIITSGMYYQTCDLHKCFPPETKTKALKLKAYK